MRILRAIYRRIIKVVINYIVYPCYRLKLKNADFTLIANNCNGAIILHDLKLKYNTPTVNLWIQPSDFVRLCSNLQYYINVEMDFIKEEGISYPIGVLDDVKIYFMHYNSNSEAQDKWNERKKRINFDNIFLLMAERDNCDYQTLKAFDNLPIKTKLVLTHRNYPEFKSTYKISGFEEKNEVGLLYEYKHEYSPYRYLYDFNFVKWFNDNLSNNK